MSRVVVTAMDCTTPYGIGADLFYKSLLKQENGIKFISSFDSSCFPVKIGGDLAVDIDCEECKELFGIYPRYRLTRCGLKNAYNCFEQAGMLYDVEKYDIGCFVSDRETTLMVNIEMIEAVMANFKNKIFSKDKYLDVKEIYEYFKKNKSFFDDKFFSSKKLSNIICSAFNLRGRNVSIGTACASGNDNIGRAYLSIKNGLSQMAICGGAYELDWFGMLAFSKLGALSKINDPDISSCPFDVRRSGFVMGSGIGLLLLESLNCAIERGAKILAEIKGYGNACDAYRSTDPHPEALGAISAMKLALSDACVTANEIDYISAHGTSTPMNDAMEVLAIKKVFGDRLPFVNSTKSMIGHTIMAAGALEAIQSINTIDAGLIHPTRNLKEVAYECSMNHVIGNPVKCGVNTVLSNSFGFGGQNSCLIIGRYMED